MNVMVTVVVLAAVLAGLLGGAAIARAGRPEVAVDHAVAAAVAEIRREAAVDRDKDVLNTRLDAVQAEMRSRLDRLGDLLGDLGRSNAEQFGRVDRSLQAHAETAQAL